MRRLREVLTALREHVSDSPMDFLGTGSSSKAADAEANEWWKEYDRLEAAALAVAQVPAQEPHDHFAGEHDGCGMDVPHSHPIAQEEGLDVEREREAAYSHGYGDGLRDGTNRAFNATDLALALATLPDREGTNPQFAERLYRAYMDRRALAAAPSEKGQPDD